MGAFKEFYLNESHKDSKPCMIVIYDKERNKELFIDPHDKIATNQSGAKIFKFKDALSKRNKILKMYKKMIEDSGATVKIMYVDSAPTPGTNPMSEDLDEAKKNNSKQTIWASDGRPIITYDMMDAKINPRKGLVRYKILKLYWRVTKKGPRNLDFPHLDGALDTTELWAEAIAVDNNLKPYGVVTNISVEDRREELETKMKIEHSYRY